MDAHPADDPPNRYCRRLGLPTPNLDVALARSDVKVIHLMGLAVLEAGGPHRPGTILGKALGSLDHGRGAILVLLTLQ